MLKKLLHGLAGPLQPYLREIGVLIMVCVAYTGFVGGILYAATLVV